MKIKQTRIWALFLAVGLLCLAGAGVRAAEIPDLTRVCSLTLTMAYNGAPVAGGSLTLYQVGAATEQDGDFFFTLTDAFAPSSEALDHPEDPQLAARLLEFALENAIAPVAEQTVGQDGLATFDSLSAGLYLVAQFDPAPGYYPIDPFLISLPYLEDGVYGYDLMAEPKTQLEEVTTDPTEPPEDLPQTGQLWWPVPVLLCGGLVLMILGLALDRRKKCDESE